MNFLCFKHSEGKVMLLSDRTKQTAVKFQTAELEEDGDEEYGTDHDMRAKLIP